MLAKLIASAPHDRQLILYQFVKDAAGNDIILNVATGWYSPSVDHDMREIAPPPWRGLYKQRITFSPSHWNYLPMAEKEGGFKPHFERLEITRNEIGLWMHPEFKRFYDAGTIAHISNYHIRHVHLIDNEDDPAFHSYYRENNHDLSLWQPSVFGKDVNSQAENLPEWYCIAIQDAKFSGPVAFYVLEKTDAHQHSN